MFRECHFEYAGISSEPYNLILAYISNSNEDFDSGGKFELKTDTLPRSRETLLYGKDYSAKPLDFDVEIVNLEDYIPLEQMTEIKNWLFEQDGWKTLRIIDERQDYYLKCIFEPNEDIVDGYGYRGIRCTLRNASPFWYGESKTISFDEQTILANTIVKGAHDTYGNPILKSFFVTDIFISADETVNMEICPACKFSLSPVEIAENMETTISIANTSANSVDEAKQYSSEKFEYPDTSYTAFDFTNTNIADVVTVDTKYAIMRAQNHTIGWHNPNAWASLPIFKLNKGHNYVRVETAGGYLSHLEIVYTPMYRLGAF